MTPAADIHPAGCSSCAEVCEPWGAASARQLTGADIAGLASVAGVAAGLVICVMIDAAAGLHGVACMFGGHL